MILSQINFKSLSPSQELRAMLKVLQGGRVDLQDKVLYSFAAKLKQRQLSAVQPSGPCCPWPRPWIAPVAA